MTEDVKQNLPTEQPSEALPAEMLKSGMMVTYVGMIINTALIFLKLFGGIAGRSGAMFADAIHSLSDFITDIGVIIALKFIAKPADRDHAYGHGRVETAISLLMGLAVILTGIGIFKHAAGHIYEAWNGVFPEKPGIIALFMGIISIFSKEGLFQYTRFVAKKTGSTSLEANAWHHRSDAFSSVGTVIGIGGAVIIGHGWTVLDPIAAGFVSILVAKMGIQIGWNAFRELSDESLSDSRRIDVENTIEHVTGVKGVHKIRTRSLGRYVTLDAHILVDPGISVREGHEIATEVENAVRKSLGNAPFVTIHVEPDV